MKSRTLVWRMLVAALVGYSPTLIGQVVRDTNAQNNAPIIVTGRVTAGDEDVPLPRVRISVQGEDRQQTSLTNDAGQFQLLLPPGTGGLRMSKTGFAPIFLERSALRTGMQLSVRLAPGGGINGVVTDSQGLPAVRVQVRVRRVNDGAARPGVAQQSIIETDDLGEFRVGNLAAGHYTVQAGFGGRGGGGRDGLGAVLDLIGGPDGLRGIADQLTNNNGDLRALFEGIRGGQPFDPAAQGDQGRGGFQGRGGQPAAQGDQGRGGGNGRGGNNGGNAAAAPQQQANAGRAQNAPDPNAQGGRGNRGRGGRGNETPTPEQPQIEVIAGQDASVNLTYDNPETALVQELVTTISSAQRTAQPAVNGIVRGRVLGADARPLKGATVQLNPVNNTGTRRAAVSDASGRYEMTGVAAGTYRAHVTKSGLPDVEYGQSRSLQAGRVITVALNQRVEGIDVMFPRPAVVTGAVVNAWGEPMEDISLQVWQASFVEGRTTLAAVNGVRTRRTDDRGRYRLYGLLPGSYYVVATENAEQFDRGPQGEQGSSPRVFYPGVLTVSGATPVMVDVGQDAAGIDFTFNGSRAGQIKGVATSSNGQPGRGRAVLAVSERSGEPMLPLQTARIDEEGGFAFDNVAAGDYVVQIVSNAGGDRGGAGGRGGNDGGNRGGRGGGQRGGGGNQGGLQQGNPGQTGGTQQQGRGFAGGATAAVPGAAAQGAAAQGGRGATPAQAAGGQAGRQGGGAPGAQGNRNGGTQNGNNGRRGQGNNNARNNRPVSDREFGMAYVTVNEGEAATVRIDTAPGAQVTGQLMLEGDTTGTLSPNSFSLTAYSANSDTAPLAGTRQARATVNDDWTFAFDELVGANRIAMQRAPEGWWLKSVYVNGVNAVEEPVVFSRGDGTISNVTVTFASGAGAVEGSVLDDRRQPTGEFGVVVFVPEAARWFSRSPYVRFATAAQDGRFSVTGLPPAEYLVAALDHIDGGADFGDWQNPAVLTALAPTARRVKIGPGQTASTELRILRRAR